MKYCRFCLDGQIHYGLVEERGNEPWIVDLTAAPDEDLAFHLSRARASSLVSDPAALKFEPMPFSAADLLAPVTPSKIVCVGRNYREHAAELGNQVPAEPLLFFKPLSSLLKPGGAIQLPPASSRVDHEGELAIVIGGRASKLDPGFDTASIIRGYTLANDVTARDLQKKDGQWTRAKGFDTFCPSAHGSATKSIQPPGSSLKPASTASFASRAPPPTSSSPSPSSSPTSPRPSPSSPATWYSPAHPREWARSYPATTWPSLLPASVFWSTPLSATRDPQCNSFPARESVVEVH